ncbi:jg15607 [Pararge aegeria aegeria]|uniref:Jg15607 protein n=1 Tax=Pararge aegeria aegeria TaxID=348720 RepID=A0A8S4RU81_9NEOP|nr:jg15607 [Pararge aegeria aegeria]
MLRGFSIVLNGVWPYLDKVNKRNARKLVVPNFNENNGEGNDANERTQCRSNTNTSYTTAATSSDSSLASSARRARDARGVPLFTALCFDSRVTTGVAAAQLGPVWARLEHWSRADERRARCRATHLALQWLRGLRGPAGGRDAAEDAGAALLETEQERRERWRSVYVIYFTMFQMSLGFSIVLTGVWPYLDKENVFTSNPQALCRVVRYSIYDGCRVATTDQKTFVNLPAGVVRENLTENVQQRPLLLLPTYLLAITNPSAPKGHVGEPLQEALLTAVNCLLLMLLNVYNIEI